MSLSSTSTLREIRAAYLDNADYDAAGDLSKARAFVQACRILLVVRPKRSAHGNRSEEVEFDLEVIRQQEIAAVRWLAQHTAGAVHGTYQTVGFENFR